MIHHHKPEYPVKKKGLLHSGSRSQRRFRLLVNVCPDDIFWITVHFVTKFGMVMLQYEPECHAEILLLLVLLSSRSMSQWRLIWLKYNSFYFIFWTVDSLATKRGLMIHHHKPECHVKKLVYCIQGEGHGKGSKCLCLSRWYPQIFCFQTLDCDASLWVRMSCKKIDLLFSRSRSLQELIWSK